MRLAIVALTCLAAVGCTDADLYTLPTPVMRLGISATVCAPAPLVQRVPYKILFVIDTSLSNTWNDAAERRVAAYRQAIAAHQEDNVYFGIVTFSDYAHRPTLVFTQDQEILSTAAEGLTNAKVGGGTNYEDAITEAYQFIVDDVSATAPLEVARSHYLVYWLSDGFPTFGTTDRQTLVANVRALRGYVEPKVEEFRLHTLYLESSGVWESEVEIAEARQLLVEMAAAGGGTFSNITTGDSFSFAIDPQPQLRSFDFASVVVSNRHVRFGAARPLPDSDVDGIDDAEEAAAGLDPARDDSDGDGWRDGIELMSVWLDPRSADTGCATGETDADADGLRDCEEAIAGTDARDPDTDRDYLPDGLEVALRGSPLNADPLADRDLDGFSDSSEVLAHLDPGVQNSGVDMQEWGYKYQLAETPAALASGGTCYGLYLHNLAVYETLATDSHPRGWQLFDIFVAFATADSAGLVRLAHATAAAGMLLPDVREPATGELALDAAAFTLLPDLP